MHSKEIKIQLAIEVDYLIARIKSIAELYNLNATQLSFSAIIFLILKTQSFIGTNFNTDKFISETDFSKYEVLLIDKNRFNLDLLSLPSPSQCLN